MITIQSQRMTTITTMEVTVMIAVVLTIIQNGGTVVVEAAARYLLACVMVVITTHSEFVDVCVSSCDVVTVVVFRNTIAYFVLVSYEPISILITMTFAIIFIVTVSAWGEGNVITVPLSVSGVISKIVIAATAVCV